MATIIFECLRKANININILNAYTYDATAFSVSIRSRCSLKTFNKIPGTWNIVRSLGEFRTKIEEYAYGLQKY